MAKRSIKISESQYKEILENINELDDPTTQTNKLNVNANSIPGKTPEEKSNKVKQMMGAQANKINITIPVDEGKVITKKELKENRLKKMKKNSTYIKIKDIK